VKKLSFFQHASSRVAPKISIGISDTVSHRFLVQAGINTITFARHHHHHFPTLPLEHLEPIPELATDLFLHSLLYIQTLSTLANQVIGQVFILCDHQR
jgi:hypothetical protein